VNTRLIGIKAGTSKPSADEDRKLPMNIFNKKAVAAISVAVIAGLGVYLIQQRRLDRVDAEQRRALAEMEQSFPENMADAESLRATEQQIKALRKETRELPKLRNEVTRLRQQKTEKATLTTGDQTLRAPLPPGKYISPEQLAFAGYETPEASEQSANWSLISGDYEVFTNTLGSNFTMNREQFEGQCGNLRWGLKGFQILARKTISDDHVELKVRRDLLGDKTIRINRLVRIGNEWKAEGGGAKYSADWEKTGTIETFTP
jgi:hypothetical protein